MSYRVNEVFYSLQGEGARAGSANVFVRFSGCNLTCNVEEHGFDCDTEFASGVTMDTATLVKAAVQSMPDGLDHSQVGVIFTGGEPALQLDPELLSAFRMLDFAPLCVETNGTNELPSEIDWISCSPKTAEHTLRVGAVDELRYVRRDGMGLPRPTRASRWQFISPAAQPDGTILYNDLAHCIKLVKENPEWRLSVQQHKTWGVR